MLKGGKFNRPVVEKDINQGGGGAFSLVLRADTIDLEDGDMNGGPYNSPVAGTEWWPTAHIHAGLNLYSVDADLGTSTSGLDATYGSAIPLGLTADKVTSTTLRLQFDF